MRKKMILIFLVVVVILGILVASYLSMSGEPSDLKTANFLIGEKKLEVEIADSASARATGLSYRKSLDDDKGVYFIFDSLGSHSFWMKDMNFPIDIIWIKDDKIVGVAENVPHQPGAQLWQLKSYAPPEPVNRVLEVNAGWFSKNGIKIGDRAELTES